MLHLPTEALNEKKLLGMLHPNTPLATALPIWEAQINPLQKTISNRFLFHAGPVSAKHKTNAQIGQISRGAPN